MDNPRIDLAHEPDFAIGVLNVHPSTREVSRDGDRQVVEPRVMQVLVALYRARGAVVSKDDLALSCWEGRVVGEDAINRVLSRLRKVSEGVGEGIFRVETVTRIGYRLITGGQDGAPTAAPDDSKKTERSSFERRAVLIGGAIAFAAVGGSTLYLNRQVKGSTELAALLDEAEVALKYATAEQTASAVGLLQEASRRFPRNADVWGKLAIAYRRQGVNNLYESGPSILDRSQAAALRALEIDRGNVDGAVVLAVGKGLWYESYDQYDKRTQKAFARFPDHEIARGARSVFLFETGRILESLTIGGPMVTGAKLSPRATSHARKLWSIGRLDEAESLLDRLTERWPQNLSIWRTRFAFLSFSGRFKESAAMLANPETWPDELEEIDIEPIRAQLAAFETSDSEKIAQSLRYFDAAALIDHEMARNAVGFAAAVGRADVAFDYLDLLLINGELAGNIKKAFPARYFQRHSGKHTYFLFEPPMRAVRADPRFRQITARLGLEDYWQKAGVVPDYRA